MICIKSPFRVSYFGGGSDFPEWFNYNGGSVLTSTINKYVYLLIKDQGHNKKKYSFQYSSLEQTNQATHIKHPAFKKFIKHHNIKNIDLTFLSDLPSFSGLASSSALTVSLMNYFYNSSSKKNFSKRNLALKSIEFERNILKEKVGYQDQVAIAYGGINKITFNNNQFKCTKINISNSTKRKLNKNFILLDSGIQRFSSNVQKDLVKSFEKSRKLNLYLLDMVKYVDIGKKYLENGEIDNFGKLFDLYWKLKKQSNPISVSNQIEYIYDMAIDHGAYGGKLLGAGSGGFFLFYVPEKNQKNFYSLTKKFNLFNYEVSDQGSEIKVI